MSFIEPRDLWLLLIIPPGLIVFYWWAWRERDRLMTQFIRSRLLPGLIAGISPTRRKIRAACLILAVASLIVCLARPIFGFDWDEVRQRGLDIVIGIDTSKSMLAEDIAPNRLERAKLAALDLMRQAKSDRLGLVAFAGTAFLECPLTVDNSAFRQTVQVLDVNTLPEGGTALAGAIDAALKAFKEGDNYKILVLFTDGEDHDSAAVEEAKKAAKAGLHIFTIGIGSAKGELLRITGKNGQTDYIRDQNGNVVKSHLNEDLLRQIAKAANGFYLPLTGADTMNTLYEKGLAPLPKSESKEKWVKRPHERYHWPLALAIALLIAELLIPERKVEPARTRGDAPAKAAAVAAVLVLCLIAPRATASPSSAFRHYKSGDFNQALKEYEQSLEKHSDDPRLHFDAGAAAYRDGQFDEAAKHFDKALNAPDLKLQEQAYYNLGNTLYQMGERDSDPSKKSAHWEDSIKRFQSSLKLDPNDSDAKANYSYVKKKLEELKKQQQQKQNQSDQNKDQKKNDQKDQKQNDKNQQNQNQQNQDQKNQQSDKDQQQKSNEQQQKRNSSEKKSQQNQQQSDQKKDQQNQQQANQSPEQKEKQQQKQAAKSAEQQKKEDEARKAAQAAYAAGQMTPQQARQLLDAQKGNELLLPAKPDQKAAPQNGPIKDW